MTKNYVPGVSPVHPSMTDTTAVISDCPCKLDLLALAIECNGYPAVWLVAPTFKVTGEPGVRRNQPVLYTCAPTQLVMDLVSLVAGL